MKILYNALRAGLLPWANTDPFKEARMPFLPSPSAQLLGPLGSPQALFATASSWLGLVNPRKGWTPQLPEITSKWARARTLIHTPLPPLTLGLSSADVLDHGFFFPLKVPAMKSPLTLSSALITPRPRITRAVSLAPMALGAASATPSLAVQS